MSSVNIAATFTRILEETGNEKLVPYAAIVNQLMPVNMPSTTASSMIKGKRRDRMIGALLLAVMKHMVLKFPAVIVIDDCHQMNSNSWDFAAQV